MIKIELDRVLDILDSVDGGGYGFKEMYFDLARELSDESGLVALDELYLALLDDEDDIECTIEIATQNGYICDVTDKMVKLYPELINEVLTSADEYPMLDYYGLSSDNFEILD